MHQSSMATCSVCILHAQHSKSSKCSLKLFRAVDVNALSFRLSVRVGARKCRLPYVNSTDARTANRPPHSIFIYIIELPNVAALVHRQLLSASLPVPVHSQRSPLHPLTATVPVTPARFNPTRHCIGLLSSSAATSSAQLHRLWPCLTCSTWLTQTFGHRC